MKKLVLAILLTVMATPAFALHPHGEESPNPFKLSEFCLDYIDKHKNSMDVHEDLVGECQAAEAVNKCITNLKNDTMKYRRRCYDKHGWHSVRYRGRDPWGRSSITGVPVIAPQVTDNGSRRAITD